MHRAHILQQLKNCQPFDLVVIGGGAGGCGIALDAACRGLKVALVEKNDFAEGTSGRSTKLVHGGVRYLEKAITGLDRDHNNLVRDGLRERSLFLHNARHLTNRLALVTPIYNWFDVPYILAGLKLYDLLSGKSHIGHSKLLSRSEALRRFPLLKAKGLRAGVLYYDGQFHDARMNLALATTAAARGAVVVNHMAVTGFEKTANKITGVTLTDQLVGDSFSVPATGVINASGPFVDRLRQLDDPTAPPLLTISSGIHIVLDGRFAPPDTGLMIPQTDDGRVLFVLPWEGYALIGTTDEPAPLSEHPRPEEEEIDYLLRHAVRYFNLQITRADIKAVWSGLRPLVADPHKKDTAGLARDHILVSSSSGLLTLTGGKWTTYRKMALDTLDHAIKIFNLKPPVPECRTADLPLIGSSDFELLGGVALQKRFSLTEATAAYINRNYGDQADRVLELGESTGTNRSLVDGHPCLEAEVIYAVRYEMAQRVMDVLARRTPLALLDTRAARSALGRVVELMGAELEWDQQRCEEERVLAEQRLEEGI